ncbi:MAG: hypothetical protein IJ934_04155 [Acetobacter sp.]|nr:hypothetical protein [Acetobacter sp.]
MQEFLNAAFENRSEDLHSLGDALDVLARAKILTELEHKTKIRRKELCRILLGAGNPTPEALTKIAEALGLEMPVHFGKTLPLQSQTPISSQTFYSQRQQEQTHAHVRSSPL